MIIIYIFFELLEKKHAAERFEKASTVFDKVGTWLKICRCIWLKMLWGDFDWFFDFVIMSSVGLSINMYMVIIFQWNNNKIIHQGIMRKFIFNFFHLLTFCKEAINEVFVNLT